MSTYESPQYEVVKTEHNFEIRKYKTFHTSSVDEKKLSGYSGFGVLFNYISGNNEKNEKMSMTVPVINTFDEDAMSMEFVVPSKYGDQDIPQPNHPDMIIKHYPEHYAAAVSFSGRATKHRVEKEKQKLQDWIEHMKIGIQGRFRLARFNPPFSLPMFRHNEIVVEIEKQT